jgi:hypothetical protein
MSNEHMNEQKALSPLNFALSDSAKQYLQRDLTAAAQWSTRGLVTCLTYCGGLAPERDGKILWNYKGPNFSIGGQKPGKLRAGRYYDLLGFRVWIAEMEQRLLEGRTLTTIQFGSPEPGELLVIENAPEDYFEVMMRGGKL